MFSTVFDPVMICEKYASKFISRIVNEHLGKEFIEKAYKYLPQYDDARVEVRYTQPSHDLDDDDVEIIMEPIYVMPEPESKYKCICTNIFGKTHVCTRDACTFAHTLQQWDPEVCKFGSKCKNMNKCQRLHNNETIEEASKRIGVKFLSQKKYANTLFHVRLSIMDKINSSKKQ